MKKLMNLVKWDLVMYYKYGLFTAGIIVSVLWIGVLMLPSSNMIPYVIPVVLLGDLGSMGYMFIAAIVYFERGQGSINAVIATPVKTNEYIKSKIISLCLYILVVSLLVVYITSFIKGLRPNFIFLLLSISITSVIYMLLGLYFSTIYKNFTDFLFPTGIVFLFLFIPALELLNLSKLAFLNRFYYIWPTYGMILLMKGIFNPISTFNLIYSLSINLIFIFLLYRKSLKEFNRKIIGRRVDINE